MQTQKPKPYFPIKFRLTLTSISSLQLQIRIACSKPTTIREKKIQKEAKKKEKEDKLENLCSFSAIVKLKIFVRPLQQQAIQKQSCSFSSTTDNSDGRHFPPPFFFLFNYCFQGFQKYVGLVEGRHIFPPFYPIQLLFQIDRQITKIFSNTVLRHYSIEV